MAASYNELFGLGTHSQDANLKGWWKLQDNAASTTIVDSSSNAANGTLTGAGNTSASTTTGPNGWLANAISLDGSNDYISFPLSSLGSDSATVLLFVKINSDPAAAGSSSGFGRFGESSVADGATHYPWTDGNIYCSTLRGTSSTALSRVTVGNPTPSLTSWRKVCVKTTPGASGWKFRIDGSSINTATGITGLYTGSSWQLGFSQGGINAYMAGQVAQLAIFNRHLTDAEEADAFAGPEPLNTAAPSISGSTTVGSVLTCSTGTWNAQSNGTLTYSYQWKNAGSNISGATSSTYTIQIGDTSITCVVRASNDGGYDSAQDTTSSNTVTVSGGSSQTIALGVATETDTAPSLTISNPRSYSLGVATEIDTVPALTVSNPRSYALGVASESDSAPSLTITNPRSYALGVATEVDTAPGLTVGMGQTISLGVATETDTAPSITVVNPRSYALGVATEVNAALSLSILNPRSYSLGVAMEVDTAPSLSISGGTVQQQSPLLLNGSPSTLKAF